MVTLPGWLKVIDLCFALTSLAVAIPAIGAQYSMFQAAPAPKMIEDGKIHTMEHMIDLGGEIIRLWMAYFSPSVTFFLYFLDFYSKILLLW